jgi:uncharacterized membrane-anchored protein YitT (DUF2179 family)
MIILLVTWRFLSKQILVYTLLGSGAFSLFYFLLENHFPFIIDLTNHMFLAAVLGGILSGSGLGIILRVGGATGGDELLMYVLNKYVKLTIGQMFFLFDTIVIVSSLYYLTWTQAVYTILATKVGTKVMDIIYQRNKIEEEKSYISI